MFSEKEMAANAYAIVKVLGCELTVEEFLKLYFFYKNDALKALECCLANFRRTPENC